jgi:hypothetical protein
MSSFDGVIPYSAQVLGLGWNLEEEVWLLWHEQVVPALHKQIAGQPINCIPLNVSIARLETVTEYDCIINVYDTNIHAGPFTMMVIGDYNS